MSDGTKFVGSFKNHAVNGTSTGYYKDGSVYKGQYKNGLPNGKGTLTIANGSVQKGMFKDGNFLNNSVKKKKVVKKQKPNLDVSNNKKSVIKNTASQGIDFQLAKLKSGVYKCEVFFNVTNSSGLNITFGNARYISELADIIKDKIPNVIIEEGPKANDKPIRGTLEIERAKKYLDFTPSRPLEKGYANYCDWYLGQWTNLG